MKIMDKLFDLRFDLNLKYIKSLEEWKMALAEKIEIEINNIDKLIINWNEFDLKMKQWITWIQQENKADLLINRLLLIWRIMAECHIWTELSQEFIKTHDEIKEYHKKIIEEYENKIAPKFIKVDDIKKYHSFNTKDKKYWEWDNVEEAINKRTRN